MPSPPLHHFQPDERAIVRAACAPPAQAAAAWREWRTRNEIESADPMQARLLPWIFERRAEIGIDPADHPLLHSIERRCWMRNQTLLSAAAGLTRTLREAGIDVLFVKGLALMRSVYPAEGLCFMSDLDFMVKRAEVERATATLLAAGYTPAHGPSLLASVRSLGPWHHHHSLISPDRITCDLHWNLLLHPTPAIDETPLWEQRQPLLIRGETAAKLPPEEMLLQTLCRGFSWERDLRSLRWMVDAARLVRSGSLDWERLAAVARARQVSLHALKAARHLENLSPGTLPDVLFEALRAVPTRAERISCHYLTRDFREVSLSDRLGVSLLQAQRRAEGLRQRILKIKQRSSHS
jgi:hypothetical protein